jgi:hypothetical protein
MKFIPITVETIRIMYSLIFPEFSSFFSHSTDCISTSSTPIFRMFFISSLVPSTTYIPPKRSPEGEGMNPAMVIIP